jgi:hypothetical protein
MAFRSRPSFVMPAPNRLDRHGTNLAVLLLSLSQPYTGITAVLVDELDARRFHCPALLPSLLVPLHPTLAYSQTDTDLAGLIVGEMNAGLL